MTLRPGRRPIAALLLLTALLASACSGSATTTISDQTSGQEANATQDTPEPTAEPEPTATPPQAEPTAAPAPTAVPEPTPTPEPDTIFFASGLEVGDCFNRDAGNPSFQPPDVVSCDEPHEEEVYAKAVLSDSADAPYPGEDTLADRVAAELCDAATVDFAGATWDLIPVTTFLLYPLEDEWDAGDRNIMCSAASSVDGEMKIGTAAAGTIRTNDVLVARVAVSLDGNEFNDFAVVTQHATIDTVGSLSDGQFDLPLQRPFALPVGFVFNSTPAGEDTVVTETWGYNWRNRQFSDLGSVVRGQVRSTLIANSTVIFAARPTPDDNYDIFTTASGDAEILVGGPGNQQYVSVTPDQTQLVYHDNGDIWVADFDGSNPLQLTSGPANDYENVVSPDGTTVVFASDRSGNDDLWAVPITGGDPVNLTNHPADESWPVFSEDGSHIYFASDRLVPADDRSVVMVMNADGSNQSWFASTQTSHPIVVPSTVADEVLANAPTFNERYSYELIQGEPGTTATWTHPNGRLAAELPVGWRVLELDDGSGFIASPRPDRYFDVWEVDGVQVTLVDDQTEDGFFTLVDATTVVQSCEQFDGSGGVGPVGDGTVGFSANFNCGTTGAVAGVIAFYNQTTGVGVIIEGQRDNLLDEDRDREMLTAIARSVTWE